MIKHARISVNPAFSSIRVLLDCNTGGCYGVAAERVLLPAFSVAMDLKRNLSLENRSVPGLEVNFAMGELKVTIFTT